MSDPPPPLLFKGQPRRLLFGSAILDFFEHATSEHERTSPFRTNPSLFPPFDDRLWALFPPSRSPSFSFRGIENFFSYPPQSPFSLPSKQSSVLRCRTLRSPRMVKRPFPLGEAKKAPVLPLSKTSPNPFFLPFFRRRVPPSAFQIGIRFFLLINFIEACQALF